VLKRLTIWVEESTLADLKRIAVIKDRSVGWLVRKAATDLAKKEAKKK